MKKKNDTRDNWGTKLNINAHIERIEYWIRTASDTGDEKKEEFITGVGLLQSWNAILRYVTRNWGIFNSIPNCLPFIYGWGFQYITSPFAYKNNCINNFFKPYHTFIIDVLRGIELYYTNNSMSIILNKSLIVLLHLFHIRTEIYRVHFKNWVVRHYWNTIQRLKFWTFLSYYFTLHLKNAKLWEKFQSISKKVYWAMFKLNLGMLDS